MADVTNKQHYVFQAYLKHWANSSQTVWCLDKTSMHSFPSSTDKILSKRRLYKIQELNEDERKFFIMLMVAQHIPDSQQQTMLEHIDDYLMPFTNRKIADCLRKINPIEEGTPLFLEIQNELEKLDSIIHKQIVNNEEDFYSDYEGEGIQWINSLIAGDAGFYSDPVEKSSFLTFVCIQYFRTVGMRTLLENGIKQIKDYLTDYMSKNTVTGNLFDFDVGKIDPKHVVPHMIWIVQTKCSSALANANLQILRNNTGLPFVTSDQPVINMKAPLNGEAPKEFVLFYPLDPKVAIVVNGDKGTRNIDNRNEIDSLNKLIWDHSFQYIVSEKEGVLVGMVDMYG